MACGNENKKCFTFIWKIENASYWWTDDYLTSPAFTVDEIFGTNWVLELDLSVSESDGNIRFFLQRKDDNKNAYSISIDWELAFLSSHGLVLYSRGAKNSAVTRNVRIGSTIFPSRNGMFFNGSAFLSQGMLTARCKIWKSVREMSQDVQCFARTRIVVEKRSFLWNIDGFSYFSLMDKKNYEIKSLGNGEQLMCLELFATDGKIYGNAIRLKIIPNFKNVNIFTLQMFIVDSSGNTEKCFQDEFWCGEACDDNYPTLIYTKNDLLEKNVCLPEDVLCLLCKCTFSLGKIEEGIENINIDRAVVEKEECDSRIIKAKENELPVPKGILINGLKSMLNNNIHSDIKLKTSSNTYPAHKCILSVRSPVFNAMFSSDMKEKTTDCVNIEDLNDGTVLLMLRYIYSGDVDELEWVSATELYEAADKYQILSLKDICSSYLKRHLAVKNVCEALILADMHQDENLKSFVQDFILIHGNDVINSEEWEQLAKTNLKLAYDTMRLKFTE